MVLGIWSITGELKGYEPTLSNIKILTDFFAEENKKNTVYITDKNVLNFLKIKWKILNKLKN